MAGHTFISKVAATEAARMYCAKHPQSFTSQTAFVVQCEGGWRVKRYTKTRPDNWGFMTRKEAQQMATLGGYILLPRDYL